MEIVGFEHLHLHTDFSLLDGLGKVEEYAQRARAINQRYLCVTDHGSMGAIPRQIRACEQNNITPIFGIELYHNPRQTAHPDAASRRAYMESLDDVERKRLR